MLLPTDFGYLSDYVFSLGNWISLMEFWHSPDWTNPAPFPFRISLYVVNSPDLNHLNFGIQAQFMNQGNFEDLWTIPNTNFNLPFNEWLEMEVYYKEGNLNEGRFYLAVTPVASGIKTILFDVSNFTHHPDNLNPNGLKALNPMKLYCSENVVNWVKNHQPNNGTLKVFWDDFDFRKDSSLFVTGIKNTAISKNEFQIYPNLVNETMQISFSENLNLIEEFQIFNALGILVKEIKVSNSEQINLANLQSGLFFISPKNRRQFSEKFIKL